LSLKRAQEKEKAIIAANAKKCGENIDILEGRQIVELMF